MHLLPLLQFASEVLPGVALPWGVRDSTGKLLLARGYVIADMPRVQALLERGMFVDADEAAASRSANRPATSAAQHFITRWEHLQADLAATLPAIGAPQALDRVREAAVQLESLSELNPDLLIFLILRQDPNRRASYGTVHALHVAAVCSLLARRLQWEPADRSSFLGAALTMNLSIVELQGRLASQPGPPSQVQRQQIHDHPVASANLLRHAGLHDDKWLAAVEQHHEVAGGAGYPAKVAEPMDMALLIRFVDMLTAKLSPRADRGSLPANLAARDLFKETNGHPHVATLIKEFGIYPPGCFVKLASGETGVVLRRTASANAPVVASITNGQGAPVSAPVRRDTSQPDHAVVSIVPDNNVMVRVAWDRLYEKCSAG